MHIYRMSTIVILSSSPSSLLLLSSVGPFCLNSFELGHFFPACTRFLHCRFIEIASSSRDNAIALVILLFLFVVGVYHIVGGGSCLLVLRASAVVSRSRFRGGIQFGGIVASLCLALWTSRGWCGVLQLFFPFCVRRLVVSCLCLLVSLIAGFVSIGTLCFAEIVSCI